MWRNNKDLFSSFDKNTLFFLRSFLDLLLLLFLLMLFHLICLLYDFEYTNTVSLAEYFLLSIKSTPTETFNKLQSNKNESNDSSNNNNNEKVSYFGDFNSYDFIYFNNPHSQSLCVKFPFSSLLKCSFALCWESHF